MKVPWISLLALLALGLTSCEEKAPEHTPSQTSGVVEEREEVAPRRGVDVDLGELASPALTELVETCHTPDEEELAALVVMSDDDASVELMTSLWDIELPEEQFARDAKLEKMRERLDRIRAALEEKVLCLELFLDLERYDYDQERYIVGSATPRRVMPDPTSRVAEQRSRLSLQHDIELDPTARWPLMIMSGGVPEFVRVSKEDAERVNGSLIPAAEKPEEGEDAASSDDAAVPDQLDGVELVVRVVSKSEPEALIPWLLERGSIPTSKKPRGAASEESQKLNESLAGLFATRGEHRRARAHVFFSSASIVSKNITTDESTGVYITSILIKPFHTILSGSGGEVFAVVPAHLPPTSPNKTYTNLGDRDVRKILETSCRGRSRKRVKTVREGGSLVDRVTYSCSKCPAGSSNPESETYGMTRVLTGSFLAPGSRDSAVMFDGCEPMSHQGGGALVHTWSNAKLSHEISWVPGMSSNCHAVSISPTRSHIVCESWGISAGEVSGAVTEFELSPAGIATRRELAPILDARGSCREGKHFISKPVSVRAIKDGAHRLEIDYEVGHVTYGPDEDCEDEVVSVERVRVILDSDGEKLVASPGSSEDLKSMQKEAR